MDKANTAVCYYLECVKELNEFILEKYANNTKGAEGLSYKYPID